MLRDEILQNCRSLKYILLEGDQVFQILCTQHTQILSNTHTMQLGSAAK